jgi:hypothetical protein
MGLADKQRLDRLERTTAQLASALKQCVGWNPAANKQFELVEVWQEQQRAIARERQHRAEQRERVSA